MSEKLKYPDPLTTKKHKPYFRLETKNLDKLWSLTQKEMMLLFNIWIKNKENQKYSFPAKQINKVSFPKEENKNITIKISSHYNSKSLERLQKLGLIKINGKRNNSYIEYPFKQNNDFRNIPLAGYYNWLIKAGKTSGFRTFAYLLYELYRQPNYNSIDGYGVKELKISAAEIAQGLNLSISSARRHLKKIAKLDLLEVEHQKGKKSLYRIPEVKIKIIKDKEFENNDIEYYLDLLENKKCTKKELKRKYGKNFGRFMENGKFERL